MKAVVIREFGVIGSAKIEDVPEPSPGPHDLLVDIELAPVNFVDTLVIEGKYQFLPERPFIPGKGPVGTVRAVGRSVGRFQPGDRVLAMAEHGGYAQAICVHEDQCYGLPDTLSFETAVSISLAYDTAWFALTDRARVATGDSVLVLGATGAIGNAAIQLAKAMGAKVIAAVSTPSKIGLALEAGADHIVDLSRPNLSESLREQVYAANAGRGVDIVIDPLGGDAFDAAIRALAWRGRLVVIGFAAGRIPTLKVNYLLLKNIEVSGIQVSDYRKRMPEATRACFAAIFDYHAQGLIRTMPVVRYPLAHYATALGDLIERRISGRAVLTP
jgi:NADPH2:quinone reductase